MMPFGTKMNLGTKNNNNKKRDLLKDLRNTKYLFTGISQKLDHPVSKTISGGSRIFCRGDMDLLGGDMDLRREHFLPKMYAKMKELSPIGGCMHQARPLDPPMTMSYHL